MDRVRMLSVRKPNRVIQSIRWQMLFRRVKRVIEESFAFILIKIRMVSSHPRVLPTKRPLQ